MVKCQNSLFLTKYEGADTKRNIIVFKNIFTVKLCQLITEAVVSSYLKRSNEIYVIKHMGVYNNKLD